MRQLWQTGWMHNRARMITASFLTKNLLIDWRLGEQWFFETLVDADEAVNPFSWQWVAGCGTDSSPYFRIFNPILQSQKFDSNGDYIKRFVKELDFISSNEKLYEPWKFYSNVKDFYFEPITDLLKSRQKALDNFHKIKNKKY
jgi:deoxyribodipyrimidine photo-lyase